MISKYLRLIALFLVFIPHIVQGQKILVAVAANAQYPLEEIKNLFEKKHGSKVELIIGATGRLAAQIEQGAPFDIFLAADTIYTEALFQKKLITGKPVIYAEGVLVLCFSDRGVPAELSFLTSDKIKKIAIANPKSAPYGKAALEVLHSSVLPKDVTTKIITGESISQVNNYLLTDVVDAAFTSSSSMHLPEFKNARCLVPDPHLYQPLRQAAVLLKSAAGNKHAADFFHFLLTEEARSIFLKHGYRIPSIKK